MPFEELVGKNPKTPSVAILAQVVLCALGMDDSSGVESIYDFDGDALVAMEHKKKRRLRSHASESMRDGPQDLEGILSIPRNAFTRVVNGTGHSSQGIKQMADQPIVVTASFAGLGSFEAEVSDLLEVAHHAVYGREVQVVIWAATDIDADSQTCLRLHDCNIRHRFENVLGRLPNMVRSRCLSLQDRVLADYKQMKIEVELQSMSKQEFGEKSNQLVLMLFNSFCQELGLVEFNETDWRLQCEQQCPISPRSDPAFRNALWLEGCGHTCKSWSAASDRAE